MKKRLIIALLLAVATTHAELEWKSKSITLKAQPTQTYAIAIFDFTNAGNETLSINKVQVGCGCLRASTDKKNYAPGEHGKITVRFDLNNRTGKQTKILTVESSDSKRTVLTLATNIPTVYQIEPGLLMWKKDDTAEQKTARLINPNKAPIKLLAISSSNEALPAELKTIREGFEYEVIVTRKRLKNTDRAVLRITTEPPAGQEESKLLKLYVVAQSS